MDEVRAGFERVLASSKLRNGQTAVLQVVDTTVRTMVLRALVGAGGCPPPARCGRLTTAALPG